MQFDSLAEFIAMGSHGFYVWLAYGTTATVLVCYLINLRVQRRRILNQIKWQQDDATAVDTGVSQVTSTGTSAK